MYRLSRVAVLPSLTLVPYGQRQAALSVVPPFKHGTLADAVLKVKLGDAAPWRPQDSRRVRLLSRFCAWLGGSVAVLYMTA